MTELTPEKAARLVRKVHLTGICHTLTSFQIGALTLTCQSGLERVPDVVTQSLEPGERLFMHGVMGCTEGRGDVLEAIDLEMHMRRNPEQEEA